MSESFKFVQQLDESDVSTVHRALRANSGEIVVVKRTKGRPSPRQTARFHRAYSLSRELQISGIVRSLALDEDDAGLALVMEDFGGHALSSILGLGRPTLVEALRIAIELCGILNDLHGRGVIHKGLSPHHILVNQETGQVKLIGLGGAANSAHQAVEPAAADLRRGAAAYLSPEQTGRTDRVVDFRSDFYALGAVLYELFSGLRPFPVDDPLELFHCHIARMPTPPCDVTPSVPRVVSNIVMKLLAKNAEERYQSAFGVRHDLVSCLEQLKSDGRIREFDLAERDAPEWLVIPRKLYGRGVEMEALEEAFERADEGGREFVLVSGHAGIGKTALVREIAQSHFRFRGYFVEGKFERFKRDIPYSGIIRALRELVDAVLGESKGQLVLWREKLLDALGANAQVIIDFIPESERLLGKREKVPAVGGAEAQNRFQSVFNEFVKAFSQAGRPLVVFLDDLQFADTASLRLIEHFMADGEASGVLLIGVYRDNEVDENHPLTRVVQNLEKLKTELRRIRLAPLEKQQFVELVADMLTCSKQAAEPLARVICAKTSGNPLFARVFIEQLYADRRLRFDPAHGLWEWDQPKIEELGVEGSVGDLIARRILDLPREAQNALERAACVGSTFDLRTLSLALGVPAKAAMADIWPAVEEGLVVPLGEGHDIGEAAAIDESASLRFLHDRVQETALSLLEPRDKATTHLCLGRALRDAACPESSEDRLFDVVDHLNRGRALMNGALELLDLARRNLAAALRAKSSAAYQQAAAFLSAGLGCLGEDGWENQYDLTFEIHRELSECEYLSGRHERAEELFEAGLERAKSDLDRAEIHSIHAVLYANTGRFIDNNRLGREALALLGVELPSLDDEEGLARVFEAELEEYRALLGERPIESLIDLAETRDPLQRMCLRVIMTMLSSAYVSNPSFLAVVGLKSITISLRHGISVDATFAFACWALILGARFKEYKTAFEFGRLALAFNDKYGAPAARSNVPFVLGNFVSHWRRHIRESISYLKDAFRGGVEVGDNIYASFAATSLPRYLLSYGHDHLEEVLSEIETTFAFFRKTRNNASLLRQDLLKHVVLNLLGRTRHEKTLSDESFDEAAHLAHMQSIHYGTGIALYHYYKLFTLCTWGHFAEAHEAAEAADANLPFIASSMQEVDCVFYGALSMLRLLPEAAEDTAKRYRAEIERRRGLLARWRENCEANFASRALLIEAELARAEGRAWDASGFYEEAIESANREGFVAIAALGNELAADLAFSNGRGRLGESLLGAACDSYGAWGAKGKQRALEERLSKRPSRASVERTAAAALQHSPLSSSIDLVSVIRASQVISREIELGRLLEKLMKIVLENAGASHGALLLEEERGFYLRALSEVNRETRTTLTRVGLSEYRDLPISLLNFVINTGDPVVLADACREGRFTSDPHIAAKSCKSVLCMPIVEQSRTIGLLYLENRHVAGAFTADRISTLTLLSSQVAVSLKNALTFAALESAKESLRKSEEKYRVLFENMQDVYYRCDVDGRLVTVSPSVEKLTGFSPHELAHEEISRVLYFQPVQRMPLLEVLEKRGYVEDFEVQLKNKKGRPIWVSASSHWVYDSDGNAVGVEGIVRDISARKRVESALLGEKERLAIVLRSIADGVIATDVEGRITLTNRVAESLIGRRQEESMGRHYREVLHLLDGKTREPLEAPFARVLLAGETNELAPRCAIANRDDVARYIAGSISPIRDPESRIIGAVMAFRDVTERQKMEEEILRAQKLESLGVIAGGIAHDFNNILTGVVGNLSLAKDMTRKDSPINDKLDEVERAALRARGLTQQLLTFSKGGSPIKRSTDLAALVIEAAKFVTSGRSVKCETVIADGLWRAEVDDGQITQVVNNLVINAVQAMPGGGVVIVEMSNVVLPDGGPQPLKAGPYVKTTIRDTGVGIPACFLSKIFDPFYTTKTEGNGLGLSTTYSIIQRHDGHIEVESEEGVGTAFRFYLPANAAAARPTPAPPAVEHRSMRGRALIMDDEEIVLQVCSAMMRRIGLEVETAVDGAEVIEKYSAALACGRRFDFVVMDLTIPGGLGGKEAISALIGIDPAVKAIVSSGYSNDPIMADHARYGFFAVLAKPYRLADVTAVVQRVLGRD